MGPRELAFPIVRVPIPMEMASATSSDGGMTTSAGRSKQHSSKRQHGNSSRKSHYSRQQPSETRQSDSPMERETFVPSRDIVVPERVDYLTSYNQHDNLNNHYYTPQRNQNRQQFISQTYQRDTSSMNRPYNHQVQIQAHNKSYSDEQESSKQRRKNKVKGNKRKDVSSSSHIYQHQQQKQQQQQHDQLDGYSDNNSKKSKQSLLSRASKQLKKKMGNKEEMINQDLPSHVNYTNDEDTHVREARDPSPTNEIKSSTMNPLKSSGKGDQNSSNNLKRLGLGEGNWVYSYSGSSPGPGQPTDYQGLIQTFPSLAEYSSGSTISTAFTNQLEDIAISPKTNKLKSTVVMSPITEKGYHNGEGQTQQQENLALQRKQHVHVTQHVDHKQQLRETAIPNNAVLEEEEEGQRQQLDELAPPQRNYAQSTDASSSVSKAKALQQAWRRNAELQREVNELRNQMAQREEQMKNQSSKLTEELTKLKMKSEAMANTKTVEYDRQLEAYKSECSVYRERLLQKERQNTKMEQALYTERSKVLSLESENEKLVNVANEKVGNAVTLGKAKSSELKSYMDQCEKYRESIVELERKVMSMEGNLNAKSSIATTLEEEKTLLASELAEMRASIVTIKSELSDKDAEIISLQSDRSVLQSKCSKLETTLKGINNVSTDDKQIIVMLEDENASLLTQLKEKSAIAERLQISAEHQNRVQEENASLKRKNEELIAKELQMKEELSKSEVFSSNTERLRKMLADSETFISTLQNDLSSARTNHHQQLTDLREKYTTEIDGLATMLEAAKIAKRETEIKNNSLEDKVFSLERKISEIEDEGTNQTRSQSGQLLKVMDHADDLRNKLSESSQEVSNTKRELGNKERVVTELQCKIKILEDEASIMSENVVALQNELRKTNCEKNSQIEELQLCVKDKDDAIAKLENETSADNRRKLQEIEELDANIVDLKNYLKNADSENDALRDELSNSKKCLKNQASRMKEHFSDAMNDLRNEKTKLISDIQSSLMSEKSLLEKKVKQAIFEQKRKAESDQMNESIKHQASMSSLRSQMESVEKLLSAERRRTQQLETTLEEISCKKETMATEMKMACSKLGPELRTHDLVDAIDDLLIERTQSQSKIITLNMDIKTLNSAISSLEYDKHQMSSKIRLLSEQKDNELNDLRSTLESDRKAQALSAESLIASKEQELESMRSANGELRGQIKKLSDETAQLHMSRERYDSELKQCQEEVSALKVKLSEATHDSQEKASNLAEHYMKIEDELRMQLNTARQENDTVEQQLAADRKETDRLMDDFYSQKQELTSRNIELTEKLDTIMKERDSLKNQAELRRSATISDEEYLKSKEKEIETLEYELQNAQEEARKCREIAERADRQATALKEVATQHLKGLELANNDLEDTKRVLELERIAHANQLSDLQATYEAELDKDRMTLKSSKERVEVLAFENNSLEEAVVSLRSRINKMEKTKLNQAEQIVKLETSLNGALDEAVRLGSKMDTDQMRHVEVTQTLSLFQEENNDLKQSLTGVEHEHTLFNDRISKLSAEKSNLQGQLIDKEKQLFEALNSLTHFELKLTKAEQERDRRDRESEKAHEDITRLEQTLSRLEEENQELLGHISILQKDPNIDCLYKELLEKMKVKEMQREEELREMNAKNDSLKTRLAVLTKEKNAIEGVNNKKISALQSSLESIKQQVLKRQKSSDDASTASSRTAKSGLRQTVIDLEDSVDAIKIHYEKKVHSLQHELDSARKRIEKYEQKISELSTLLEENASILNAVFHKQLKNKQNLPRSPPAILRPSESGETVDSEVS